MRRIIGAAGKRPSRQAGAVPPTTWAAVSTISEFLVPCLDLTFLLGCDVVMAGVNQVVAISNSHVHFPIARTGRFGSRS